MRQFFPASMPDHPPDLSSLQLPSQNGKTNLISIPGIAQEISMSEVFSMQPSTSCVEVGKIEESESCINDFDEMFDF